MSAETIILVMSWAGCMGFTGLVAFTSGVLVGGRNLTGALQQTAAPLISKLLGQDG
jgi:hypothetical protein